MYNDDWQSKLLASAVAMQCWPALHQKAFLSSKLVQSQPQGWFCKEQHHAFSQRLMMMTFSTASCISSCQ